MSTSSEWQWRSRSSLCGGRDMIFSREAKNFVSRLAAWLCSLFNLHCATICRCSCWLNRGFQILLYGMRPSTLSIRGYIRRPRLKIRTPKFGEKADWTSTQWCYRQCQLSKLRCTDLQSRPLSTDGEKVLCELDFVISPRDDRISDWIQNED